MFKESTSKLLFQSALLINLAVLATIMSGFSQFSSEFAFTVAWCIAIFAVLGFNTVAVVLFASSGMASRLYTILFLFFMTMMLLLALPFGRMSHFVS